MLLPESVLLGLFPQGLILSKPASWEGADDGVFTVDVSGCLRVGTWLAGRSDWLSDWSIDWIHLLYRFSVHVILLPMPPMPACGS